MRASSEISNQRPESWRILLAFSLPLLLASMSALSLRGAQNKEQRTAGQTQSAPAASKTSQEKSDTQTFRVKVEEVQVPFSVYDKKGSLVLDLKKEDFKIYEDGVEQEISGFDNSAAPLSAGLVLDTSGSMRTKFPGVQQAVLQFLRTANPEDEFFVRGGTLPRRNPCTLGLHQRWLIAAGCSIRVAGSKGRIRSRIERAR